MERESFEDKDVAKVLNDHFISIKVDREERKDLDTIYMKACQMITGSGGWPLNLWLTPDRLPVYAGTYFTKRNYLNRTGIIEVCEYLHSVFENEPNKIFNQSYQIITTLKRAENHKEATLSTSLVEDTIKELKKAYDQEFGGFSKAPKFPSPQQNLFLLDAGDEEGLDMAIQSLVHMAKGGIYDHIGGGFSRYSVDNQWLIPHFEKMLYDNGLALDVYSQAYFLTKNPSIKQVISETIHFLDTELQNPKGGFYSAYDADSEGVEGKYYRFTYDEILRVLGQEAGMHFCQAYNVTKSGNFEGYNIPNLIEKNFDIIHDAEYVSMKAILKEYRSKRVKPALDDKILSMSNGFAIHGLCQVYRYTGDQHALELAIRSYDYIHQYMFTQEGLLLASVRDDRGDVEGMIDDYAAIIRGLFNLYDVTFEDRYLEDAVRLIDKTVELFYDEEHGGFFVGSQYNKALIFNPKEIYDGATPSGNSLMAFNLLKCYLLTENDDVKILLDRMIENYSYQLNEYKHYAAYFVNLISYLEKGTKEAKIYMMHADQKESIIQWLRKSDKAYFVTRLFIDPSMCLEEKPTLYECENMLCHAPRIIEEVI
jgi:uncharacterized protein YyaL (SSP411 family)